MIAIAKWLGTLAPTLLIGVLGDLPFIIGIGLLCSVFDLIYIGLLWSAKRRPFGDRDRVDLVVESVIE